MTLGELYAQKERLTRQMADLDLQIERAKKEPEQEESPRLPRMRILSQAIKLVREIDPETAVSANYIRKLALSGEIPTVQVGKRRLINVDALMEYLTNPAPKETRMANLGQIRRIEKERA